MDDQRRETGCQESSTEFQGRSREIFQVLGSLLDNIVHNKGESKWAVNEPLDRALLEPDKKPSEIPRSFQECRVFFSSGAHEDKNLS